MVEWLKKAPTSVVVTMIVMCGLVALGVLGAYVVLSLNGADTTELRQWVQTVGITIILPLLGVNTAATWVSARSASAAEDQTNGQLDRRDREIAGLRAELDAARNARAADLRSQVNAIRDARATGTDQGGVAE